MRRSGWPLPADWEYGVAAELGDEASVESIAPAGRSLVPSGVRPGERGKVDEAQQIEHFRRDLDEIEGYNEAQSAFASLRFTVYVGSDGWCGRTLDAAAKVLAAAEARRTVTSGNEEVWMAVVTLGGVRGLRRLPGSCVVDAKDPRKHPVRLDR